jgi:hypothetical protein
MEKNVHVREIFVCACVCDPVSEIELLVRGFCGIRYRDSLQNVVEQAGISS